MRVVRASDVEFSGHDAGPRGGGLWFKTMLKGREGSLDNYLWVIAKSDGDRYSPRHRHNFDQIRFSLKGDLSIGKKKSVKEGEIGYFPEGTHYGPQDDAGAERTTLVLQFSGASGAGYLSQRQTQQAKEELEKFGTFEKGIFYRTSGEGKKNQDGFEALWEHVNQKKLVYPKRRYEEPIIFNPDSFAWKRADQKGVSRKLMGVFSERETRLEFYRLDAGATWTVPAEQSTRLGFVVDGKGNVAGTTFDGETCYEGLPGESFAITADTSCMILSIVIPSYETARLAQAAE
jgi:hypothetical protein